MSIYHLVALFYYKIRDFFSNKQPQVIQLNSGSLNSNNTDLQDNPRNILAFIDSHTDSYPGDKNYRKEYEKSWSRRINRKAISRLQDLGYGKYIYLVTRYNETNYRGQCEYIAKTLKLNKVSHVLITHFNSRGMRMRGSEFFSPLDPTDGDQVLVNFATKLLEKRLGIPSPNKDISLTVPTGHSSCLLLQALTKVGIVSCIAEPCFANNPTAESKAIFENESAYVEILVEIAINVINKKLKK
jgi:hypothetical protein